MKILISSHNNIIFKFEYVNNNNKKVISNRVERETKASEKGMIRVRKDEHYNDVEKKQSYNIFKCPVYPRS